MQKSVALGVQEKAHAEAAASKPLVNGLEARCLHNVSCCQHRTQKKIECELFEMPKTGAMAAYGQYKDQDSRAAEGGCREQRIPFKKSVIISSSSNAAVGLRSNLQLRCAVKPCTAPTLQSVCRV